MNGGRGNAADATNVVVVVIVPWTKAAWLSGSGRCPAVCRRHDRHHQRHRRRHRRCVLRRRLRLRFRLRFESLPSVRRRSRYCWIF